MIKVFIFLFAGILTGFILKDRKKILHIFDKATLWSVFFLLFLFGIEVGINEKIVANFFSVGLSGILLACGAVAGSIFFIIPVYFLVFKKKEDKKFLENEEAAK